MEQSKRPAIFLDRDGVLIVEKDFLVNPDDVEFYPETIEALNSIKNGYFKIVISNQSGVARGYFTSEDVKRVNSEISKMLGGKGIFIDAWFFCPHGPEDNCACRKPRPGMILEAAEKMNIDLENSWIIGDKSSDIEAGKASRIKTILVKTGYGGAESGSKNIDPDFTALNIREAIDYINRSAF